MKIAVIMGSPRKKDSYQICRQIEMQLKQFEPNIEMDYIFLSEHHILDCKGCCVCFQKSETLCPCKDDDLNLIKQRLICADGMIIASPVYAYQVTAQLKRFIDRMSYLFHRQQLCGKPALIVVTTDGGGSKQVYQYLRMTVSGWGMKEVGDIQIISPRYFEERLPKGAYGYHLGYHNKKQKQLALISKEFIRCLSAGEERVPSFYDIFMFHCLRSKTYTSVVDRSFWKEKGWLEVSYFYPVKMNIAKRGFGGVMRCLINIVGKRYIEK